MVLLTQQRTLAEQLSGAFIVLGAIVGGAFLLTAMAYGLGATWLTPELERSRLAERAEASSYAAMLDQDHALRDYILTREQSALQASIRAELRLRRANDSLSINAGATPELAVAMIEMRLAEERWRAEWSKVVADPQAAAAASSLATSSWLFHDYRKKQSAFAAALEQQTGSLARRGQRLIAGRVLLELFVFVAVLLLVLRQHRALRDAIVTPVAALLGHIRRIRDGQLEAAAERAAPRELAELGQGLNEVVSALVSARESAACREKL